MVVVGLALRELDRRLRLGLADEPALARLLRLGVTDRLGDRLGARLAERLGERLGERLTERPGERLVARL